MSSSEPVAGHQPDVHYDRVHDAWRLIMGEEFHYGYFATASTTLTEATAALTGEMLRRANLSPGERVLDIGCGTGRQSCDLAEQLDAHVLGITTSGAGVAAGTALAAARGLSDRARFEQRDGTDNQLPDNSFDVAWALESSHLMRDRKALLSEGARVLKPGGRWVLCDLITHRRIPFAEVRQKREAFAVLRAAFGDAHMLPLADYTTSLTELGLEVTDCTDITAETLPTFAAWRANCEAHESEIVSLIGTSGLDEFVRSCDILEAFWRDGTLGYGVLAAVAPA